MGEEKFVMKIFEEGFLPRDCIKNFENVISNLIINGYKKCIDNFPRGVCGLQFKDTKKCWVILIVRH